MTTSDILAAAEIRAALEGKRCWYAFVSMGCTFAMDLGRKVRRDEQEIAALERSRVRLAKRGKAPSHPAEYRTHKGESHLLVWCSWRLGDAHGPLASSDSDRDVCEAAVARLIGKTVRHAEVGDGWDLRLELTGGIHVSVFPDHVGPEANFDGNWELWRPEQAYLIGTDLACEVIDRENRPLRPQPRAGRWQVAGHNRGQ